VTNAEGSAQSADATFTTPALLTVTAGAVPGASELEAKLCASVIPGGNSLNLYFDYGTTTSYGSTGYPSPSYASGTAAVLTAASRSEERRVGKDYKRLKAYDTNKNNYKGAEKSFTTEAASNPANTAP